MRPDLVFVISTGFWVVGALFVVVLLGLLGLFGFVVVAVSLKGVLRWFCGVVGSHFLHFHVWFGLSVWFWNCCGDRFVHLVCVHVLHSVHSIDCWFILHCFVHTAHGYLFVLVIGFGSRFSICSSMCWSLLAVCLLAWAVVLVANRSSYVTFVTLLVCSLLTR